MSDIPKPLGLDEAIGLISDIARHGEGAERFRALKEIRAMAQEAGDTTLPDPLTDQEVIERLGRLMKAAGPTACQFAYRAAFPATQRPLKVTAPKVVLNDILVDRSTLPVNLKQLYRMFPEIKRSGQPQGYPHGKGLAVVKKWCQDKALRMLMDREQARIDEAVIAEKAQESADGTAEAPTQP